MHMHGSEWNLGGYTLTLKLDGKDPDFYIQNTGVTTTTVLTTISNGTFKVEVPSTAVNTNRTGAWNSRFSNTTDYDDKNPKVSFASNATVMVDLHGRSDLEELATSNSPYVITWAVAPTSTTFELDEATAAAHYRVRVTDVGLKLSRTSGLVIIVK